MRVGSLGDMVFETSTDRVLTPSSFSTASAARYEDHPVQGGLPRSEFLAPELSSFDLTIRLRADIGDPAAVLFAGQGLEQGVVLGTFHSKALPAPQKAPDIDYHVYEDGTEISYDRTSHTLTVNVMGDITINATGDISVQCGGTLSLDADLITMQEGCES